MRTTSAVMTSPERISLLLSDSSNIAAKESGAKSVMAWVLGIEFPVGRREATNEASAAGGLQPGEGAGLGWNIHRPEPDGESGFDASCGREPAEDADGGLGGALRRPISICGACPRLQARNRRLRRLTCRSCRARPHLLLASGARRRDSDRVRPASGGRREDC